MVWPGDPVHSANLARKQEINSSDSYSDQYPAGIIIAILACYYDFDLLTSTQKNMEVFNLVMIPFFLD